MLNEETARFSSETGEQADNRDVSSRIALKQTCIFEEKGLMNPIEVLNQLNPKKRKPPQLYVENGDRSYMIDERSVKGQTWCGIVGSLYYQQVLKMMVHCVCRRGLIRSLFSAPPEGLVPAQDQPSARGAQQAQQPPR
jgi:hypothetical protein